MNEQKKNTTNKSTSELVFQMETAISEGYQSPGISENNQVTNVFGRQVVFNQSPDLSFLLGLSASGVRAGALLEGSNLVANQNQLSAAAQQHLATVVHHFGTHNDCHKVAESGCFQLFSSSAQETADYTLIAHRIAELALIPGLCSHDNTEEPAIVRRDDLIVSYLGDPDELIDCPTPSQQMIFGGKRRRVPNWFSLDYPMVHGSRKEDDARALETAANHQYFYHHLPELIDQAFNEYNTIAGTNYSTINEHKASDADHLIISQGTACRQVTEAVNTLRNENRKVGCLNLALVHPLPAKQIVELIRGKQSVTILENMNGRHNAKGATYLELLSLLQEESLNVKVYSGQYADALSLTDITAIFSNMSNGGKRNFYVGIDFTRDESKFPKHDVLLGNIRREYPELRQITLGDSHNQTTPEVHSTEHPNIITRYKDRGPAYTRLARFYDDVGHFYKTKNKNELVADPFQAIPSAPAATANFNDQSVHREAIPSFNPANCTGCGDCFVNCPHSAIPPLVIGVESLIKSGAEIASKGGHVISKLTPQIKNIAKLCTQQISKAEQHSDIGTFLQSGFDKLVEQTGLKDEKLKELQADFDAVLGVVSNIPTAITDPFFKQPETLAAGTGELFTLTVDPYSCTGCGLCVDACAESALEMEQQTPELVKELETSFQLWEQLPDTPGDTIVRLHQDEEYSSFAAILLSRSYYMSMTGGNDNEKGAPSKSLMHLITSATESAIQPKIISQVEKLEKLASALGENIHTKLSETLPKENFDSLDKALKKHKNELTPLGSLMGELGKTDLLKQVDTKELHRKIQVLQDLNDLKWVLTEGPTGVGRSRYGIAKSGSGPWSSEHPYNNFTSPVFIHWDGSTPDMAMGLFQGQLRHLLDNIKIMRRGQLEAKDKYNSDQHDQIISELSWDLLTEEEKAMVPPILIVGDSSATSERSWAGLSKLLSSSWPVKVMVFNDAFTGPETSPAQVIAQHTSALLTAISQKNAFVLQGSMGNASHLFNGLLAGLQNSKPAFFSLFAPDPEKHASSTKQWLNLASIAHSSRAFPSLRFDPNTGGKYLSSSFDLSSNPKENMDWHSEEITYTISEEQHQLDYTFTWADWAHTQNDWAPHFTRYEGEESKSMPVAEFLLLNEGERGNKIPVILRVKEGGLQRYQVSPQVIRTSEITLAAWNTWRELAGTLIEYPEKLQQQVELELTKKYENDLAEAKADFETQLKDQEQVQVEAIRQKLKEKLLALSKQGTLN